MTTASAPVNTAAVHDRRPVRFESIDEALAEARRLTAAEQAGQTKCLGNWTVGQILNHVAAWAEYVYAPNPLTVPFFVRWMMWPMKGRFLNKGLPVGRSIPKVPGGTLHTEQVQTSIAFARFEKAFQRLKNDPPTHPSPVFGKLTQAEAIKLNLRHAELHMSFIKT